MKYLNSYSFLSYQDGLLYCSAYKNSDYINAKNKEKSFTQLSSLERLLDNRQLLENKGTLPLFRNIFWLSLENIALHKSFSLHLLNDLQNIKQM